MITSITTRVMGDINEKGVPIHDTRLKRETHSVIGYTIKHHYLDPVKKPKILEKYLVDWKRMYRTYKLACAELVLDPHSRRAVIFNSTDYYRTFQCFISMQVLESGNNEYELIVHQRSSDLAKLEDDVAFFEYVMYKVSQQTKLNVTKLTIFVGSQHYETNEG